MLTRWGLLLMRGVGYLPLPWVRALGALLGGLLYLVAAPRRRVARVNLGLCYPAWSRAQLNWQTLRVFVCFAQAWLDRGWLWHAHPATLRRRLRLVGEVHALQGAEPLLVFAPHFVGLDAGWTALTLELPRRFTTIYTRQANRVIDAWILEGRQRFGLSRLFGRAEGIKPIVKALRQGDPLYLLPDMNFGLEESVFVPFFGVPAATLPSLSRFARLTGAKVVPVITRLTRSGYDVEVMPAWRDFPSDDVVADTARMNRSLQDYIDTMPSQYYWVHKRFKSRPPGAPSVY